MQTWSEERSALGGECARNEVFSGSSAIVGHISLGSDEESSSGCVSGPEAFEAANDPSLTECRRVVMASPRPHSRPFPADTPKTPSVRRQTRARCDTESLC